MTDLSPTPTLDDLVPTLTVGETTFESKLAQDLYIDKSDLANEFLDHPRRYAFYSTCAEIASAKETSYKVNLERLYALLDHEKRSELMMAGVKVTEKMVENSVITDERYIALQEEYLKAQKDASICKSAMFAMQQRKDMLVQLGMMFRTEYGSDVSLKAAVINKR